MSFTCLAMLFFCVTACQGVNQKLGLPDDNPAEQGLEYIIEKETGIKVDLTPEEKPDEVLLD